MVLFGHALLEKLVSPRKPITAHVYRSHAAGPSLAGLDAWMILQVHDELVFEVPLAFLMDPAHHRRQGLDWEGRRHEWFAMPYQQDGAERYIWGATAGMLRNLYHFLAA